MDPNNPNMQNFDNSNQVPPAGPAEMTNSYAEGVYEGEAVSTQYGGVPENPQIGGQSMPESAPVNAQDMEMPGGMQSGGTPEGGQFSTQDMGVPESINGAQDMTQNIVQDTAQDMAQMTQNMAQDMIQDMTQNTVTPETATNVAVPMAGLTDASMANPPMGQVPNNPAEPMSSNPAEPMSSNPAEPMPSNYSEPTPNNLAGPSTMPASAAAVPPTPTETVSGLTGNGFANTAPLMAPDTEPKPASPETGLKSPFKAADPVLGSIGSALSGGNVVATANQTATQTTQPITNKKKSSKKNMIILSTIAVIVVVALVAVLVMQATGIL